MSEWFRTSASACSSACRVRSGRTTSSSERSGAISCVARLERPPNSENNEDIRTPAGCAEKAWYRIELREPTASHQSLPARLRKDDFSAGKALARETFAEAGEIARGEVAPISDVRGTRDFRLQLARNVLQRFYFDVV